MYRKSQLAEPDFAMLRYRPWPSPSSAFLGELYARSLASLSLDRILTSVSLWIAMLSIVVYAEVNETLNYQTTYQNATISSGNPRTMTD